MSVDFDRFFSLGSAFKRGAFHAVLEDDAIEPLRLLRGEVVLARRPIFRWSSGTRLYDLIATEDAFLYLISSRVVETLAGCGASGWFAYDVRLLSRDGTPISGYSGLSVTGRCGPILSERSTKVRRPVRSPGKGEYEAWIGLYFEERGWDGSDIFVPDGTGFILVSDRVRDPVQRAALTNLVFEPVSEIERLMI